MIMIWGLQIEGLIHVGEVHPLAMLEHRKCWLGEVFPAFGIKVIAEASIPLVFFSDKMTIVSCSRYFSTHGIPKEIKKKAEKTMSRVKWTNVEHKCLSLPFISSSIILWTVLNHCVRLIGFVICYLGGLFTMWHFTLALLDKFGRAWCSLFNKLYLAHVAIHSTAYLSNSPNH